MLNDFSEPLCCSFVYIASPNNRPANHIRQLKEVICVRWLHSNLLDASPSACLVHPLPQVLFKLLLKLFAAGRVKDNTCFDKVVFGCIKNKAAHQIVECILAADAFRRKPCFVYDNGKYEKVE